MTDSLGSIFDIYASYCYILSCNLDDIKRGSLAMLLKSLDCLWPNRDILFSELVKLMSHLGMSVDSRQFSCFYDFVFFICRENGQKNITVNRAVTAWKLVLRGRFRLLNQWCDFVENFQRHNISEDIWQQVFCFSRTVNEDLKGYDPEGAWPVLIDDFVEHMYSINQSKNCSARDRNFETQPNISNIFDGLNLHSGTRRKLLSTTPPEPPFGNSICQGRHYIKPKKFKSGANLDQLYHPKGNISSYVNELHLQGSSTASPSSTEDCLPKGLEGRLSLGRCFQFSKESFVKEGSSLKDTY